MRACRPITLSLALLLAALFACDAPGLAAQDPTGSGWTQQPRPVWESPSGLASDPDVVRHGDGYRMCYTCYDADANGPAICGAASPDGTTWAPWPDAGAPRGVLVPGLAGGDEELVEACALVPRGDETLLYYSGYPRDGDPVEGFPASLYLAVSTDGGPFERAGRVLDPTPGGRDNDAVYSPTVLALDGALEMVYTGHCYIECDATPGVALLRASSVDGRVWTKHPAPVLTPDPTLPWTVHGIGEAALFRDGGGVALLVTGGLGDDERHRVGIARAPGVAGPWALSPDPVLAPTPSRFDAGGVLAPSVLTGAGWARAWYVGLTEDGRYAVGLAEAAWPPAPN